MTGWSGPEDDIGWNRSEDDIGWSGPEDDIGWNRPEDDKVGRLGSFSDSVDDTKAYILEL